ncbi:MAG: hypothetical protein HY898_21520 [Deltaproteobacteria bacterium]|nr:hypothetical protein [Deltaproteobacteria bacterium]
MRSVVPLLALAVATLASSAAATPGVPCRYYGINAGAPVWNGTIVVDTFFAQQMAASGAYAVRIDFLLDGASQWDGAALGKYDAVVDAVIAAGLEPLGMMNYGAAVGGQAQWNDDPDQDGSNDYVVSFATGSQAVIEHFADRIKRWEIWNEPSCWSNPNWATDPQNAGCSYLLPRVFAKLMAEVYVRNEAVLKAHQISLVSGGLFAHDIGGSLTTATDYMSEVYAQGVWDWMQANKQRRYAWDYLGYHIYVEQGALTDGTKLAVYADDMRQLATQNNDPAPFSLTEIGWTTAAVSEHVQAVNLETTYVTLAARADVDQVFWFSFRDAPGADLYFGIRDGIGAPKEAVEAMIAVSAGCMTPVKPDAGKDATSLETGPGEDAQNPVDGAVEDATNEADQSAPDGGSAKDGAASGGDAAPPVFAGRADDSGCACRMRGGPGEVSGWWWGVIALGMGMWRLRTLFGARALGPRACRRASGNGPLGPGARW